MTPHPPHIEPMDVLVLQGLVAGLQTIKEQQKAQLVKMDAFIDQMKSDTQRLLDRYRLSVEAREKPRVPE